jgi:alpha-1,2-mannosyltransferase
MGTIRLPGWNPILRNPLSIDKRSGRAAIERRGNVLVPWTILMAETVQRGTWLSARRLRAHGLILGVALWSVYVWTLAAPGLRDRNGNLKGTDFLHFYTLGTLAREHRGGELYDMSAQAALAEQRVPPAAGLRYLPLYPPQLSILFAPFSRLPFEWALALWWIVSGAVYGICCYGIWRACPYLRGHGRTVGLLAIAFPPFFHLIAWGQVSALALGCFTLMFFALEKKREVLAGLFLGCLLFKPQLGLASAAVFLAIGAWKILAGAILSAAAQLGGGVLYYGVDPLREWWRTIWNVRSVLPWLEPKPYQTHCLRTFWSMLIPWTKLSFALYIATGLVVLAMTIASWNRAKAVPLELRFPILLLATVLVAPHLTVYDLVVLVPAILLLANWRVHEPGSIAATRIGSAVYFVYVLPLVGPLARWTHVQLSVIAMSGLMYLIWRVSIQTPDQCAAGATTAAVRTR